MRDSEQTTHERRFERIKSPRKKPRRNIYHDTPEKGCDGKTRMSERIAKTCASGHGLRHYRCHFCRHWHVTSVANGLRGLWQ